MSELNIIDSHCHLDRFFHQGRLPQILENAAQQDVKSLIAVGTGPGDWSVYRQLAELHPGTLYYTVGIHPCDIEDDWEDAVGSLAGFWKDPVKPVALGEIGIDHFHLSGNPEKREKEMAQQRLVFARQLEVAAALDCPVVIHSRNAFEPCVEVIDASPVKWERIVFHCYSYGVEEIATLLARGGRASFTGIITYKNAPEIREAALTQGADRIMIETDAPYLAPVPKRGKPNEPAYVRHTAEFCAQLFGLTLEDFVGCATENTREFYGLDQELPDKEI